MISKKDLAEYNFNSIERYFDYILQSKVNGQFGQVKDLIKKLSKNQKKKFINYLLNPDEYSLEIVNYYFNLVY